MDELTKERRSWNMSRIKGKDTKIEISVRKYLFSKGFRYRKNDKRYPGKPDVLLPKYKTAVFVNGCFWHMHEGCKQARLPSSNVDFWKAKLEKNVAKDIKNQEKLKEMGFRVVVLWECELERDFSGVMNNLINDIVDNI